MPTVCLSMAKPASARSGPVALSAWMTSRPLRPKWLPRRSLRPRPGRTLAAGRKQGAGHTGSPDQREIAEARRASLAHHDSTTTGLERRQTAMPPHAQASRPWVSLPPPSRGVRSMHRARVDVPSRGPSQPPIQLATRGRARRQQRHTAPASLVLGVAASGASGAAIVTAGIAGLVAGALSMAHRGVRVGQLAPRRRAGRHPPGGARASPRPAGRAA